MASREARIAEIDAELENMGPLPVPRDWTDLTTRWRLTDERMQLAKELDRESAPRVGLMNGIWPTAVGMGRVPLDGTKETGADGE